MKRENLDKANKIDKKLRRIETNLNIIKDNQNDITKKIGDTFRVVVKDFNYSIDFDEIFTKENIIELIKKRESELILIKLTLENELEQL